MTIPISQLVNVQPSVLSAGGTGLDMVGLVLTNSTRSPIGSVQAFPSALAVSNYFGAGSAEAKVAGGGVGSGLGYFGGFTGANKIPGSMLVAQYNQSAVAAYLRGGNISTLTLAQLQALTGTFSVTMDGYPHVAGSVSLAAATSFSSAASIIQTALTATEPTEAVGTGTIGANFTGSISGTVLTASAVANGVISVGDTVTGAGVTAGTKITSLGTGTGGTGTYNVNNSQSISSEALVAASNLINITALSSGAFAVGQTITGAGIPATGDVISALGTGTGGVGTYIFTGTPVTVVSETITAVATAPTVTFDSVSGAFVVTSGITGAPSTAAFATGTLAAPILMTSATGAVLSQGAAPAVPAAFMNALIQVNSNWATFMTSFDPDGGVGSTVKQAFAAWKNTQNNRFAYVCWDTDASPRASVPAASSLGQILAGNADSGTCLISELTDLNLAAFVCGAAAAIDFSQKNGRITFAFKAQAGLVADVVDSTTALNLAGDPATSGRGNGYNFYGAYAAATAAFVWFQRGLVTGAFQWFDSYINQIWLNNQLQLALLTLMQGVRTLPYNTAGASLIQSALASAIAAGLNFGAFAPGTISASQIAQVNAQAGANIANTLQTQGWYLQVLQASSATRAARSSPPCTFWYLDRGSVQQINLASVAVQ